MFPGVFQMPRMVLAMFTTRGSANLSELLVHSSYASGPSSRSIMSSIQSVNAQPVAGPDSMPTHHGVWPSAII